MVGAPIRQRHGLASLAALNADGRMLRSDSGMVGLRPQCGMVGLRPQCGMVGLRPQCGMVGLRPQCGMVGLRPQCGMVGGRAGAQPMEMDRLRLNVA
jgi:hypothetical protein